jgi:glycosidase
MTIPGIPTVYYGDEYGDPGANDPDNRRWMRFENYSQKENTVLENFIKLSKFRRSSMPLLYGDYIPLFADDDIISFMRVYLGQIVIVAINKGSEKRTIEVKLPVETDLLTLHARSGKLINSSSNILKIEVESKNYTLINN